MESQTELPPLACCSTKSKLICVSAGLVALVIVAIASFLLGRILVKPFPLSQIPPAASLANPFLKGRPYVTSGPGYEISYPLGWTEYAGEGCGRLFSPEYRKEYLLYSEWLSICDIYDRPEESPEYLADNLLKESIIQKEKIVIDNHEGLKIIFKNSENIPIYTIAIFIEGVKFKKTDREGTLAIYVHNIRGKYPGPNQDTIDQILSTLKIKTSDDTSTMTDTDETTGWRTYFNLTAPGFPSWFSIKYPPEWNLSGDTLKTEKGTTIYLGAGSSGRYDNEQFIQKGFPAGTADYLWKCDGKNQGVGVVSFLGHYIFIANISNNEECSKIKEVFDQMLDTFKYFPQLISVNNYQGPGIDAPTPTSNLKEYINNKAGFSVKYPSNWFSKNCGFEELLLLNPSGQPICETEPYDPIILNTKPVYVESFTEPGFKVTLKEDKTTPVKYSKFLVEKLQPAPGPDKFMIIRALLPGGAMFTITLNDLQYESIADQIISTLKITN